MLASMTGFGQASCVLDQVSYALEIKSLNGKYLKSVIKIPEPFSCYEPRIEQTLRNTLVRGSVVYTLRAIDNSEQAAWQVNLGAVRGYLRALDQVGQLADRRIETRIDLASLLVLPGVCQVPETNYDQQDRHWQAIQQLTREAIDRLTAMRIEEGKVLHEDLVQHCRRIADALDRIRGRAPQVVSDYTQRLHDRVKKLLCEAEVELREDDIARETAIFAERSDINEELARIDSHLHQFQSVMTGEEHAGRKLEFLAQEMLREVNTIGSKANDAAIAQNVVDIKGHIDRIKEQVMNVV